MAAPSLTSGGVAKLRKAPEPDHQLTLQVLTIHRCILDQERKCTNSREKQANEDQFPECADAYEVVLSDGTHKYKAGLSTRLNELVYKGQLLPLGLVRVREWGVVHDPLVFALEKPETVLIHDLRVVRAPPAANRVILPLPPVLAPAADTPPPPLVLPAPVIADPKAGLEFVIPPSRPNADMHLTRLVAAHTGPLPLLGHRDHYVKLDSDQPELTSLWFPTHDDAGAPAVPRRWATELLEEGAASLKRKKPGPPPKKPSLPKSAFFPRIGDVTQQTDAQGADARRGSGRPPKREILARPLTGRVVGKSALSHFGSPAEARTQPFPCQYTLQLADSSMRINLTVWNRLCEETYTRMNMGDIVMVRDYRLNQGRTEYEASLNPSHPTGRLQVLSAHERHLLESVVPGQMGSDLPSTFATVPQLRASLARCMRAAADGDPSWADQAEVNIHGLVLAVLPAYRHRLQPYGKRNFVRFNRARWLLLLISDPEGGAVGDIAKAVGQVPLLVDESHCGVPTPWEGEDGEDGGGPIGFFEGGVGVLDFVTLRKVRVCSSGGDGGFFLASTPMTCATYCSRHHMQDTELNEVLLDSVAMDRVEASPHDRWLAPPPPPAGGGGPAFSRLFPRLPPYSAVVSGTGQWDRADVAAGKCDPLIRREAVTIEEAARLAQGLHAGEVKQVLVNGNLSGFKFIGPNAHTPPFFVEATLASPETSQKLTLVFCMRDADAKARRGALWAAVVTAAAVPASAGHAAPAAAAVPACTYPSATEALNRLALQPQIAIALDLHKPGAAPATAELTGVWLPV